MFKEVILLNNNFTKQNNVFRLFLGYALIILYILIFLYTDILCLFFISAKMLNARNNIKHL